MIDKAQIQEQEKAPESAKAPAQPAAANLPKTTGEKYYGWLKFGVAETFILFATAVIAYWARHGKEREGIAKLANPFKLIQDLFNKALRPIEEKGGAGAIIAGAAASTMVTFHGGNAFAPAMKWFDGKKNDIVDGFNKVFGRPGEIEIGQERLKDDPKQNWHDIIKGRLVAWATVFTAVLSSYFIFGKDKNTEKPMWRFDKYEEGFGRWLAGLTKKGKDMNIGLPKKTGIPLHQKLEGVALENKTYRFGKILALDIFATTAVIAIWSVVSEFFAKKRQAEQKKLDEASALVTTADGTSNEPSSGPRHTDAIRPQERKIDKLRGDSHSESISLQREAQEGRPAQLGA